MAEQHEYSYDHRCTRITHGSSGPGVCWRGKDDPIHTLAGQSTEPFESSRKESGVRSVPDGEQEGRAMAEQRGTGAAITNTDHGAVCRASKCRWFSTGDKSLDEADVHHKETGHHVVAQRKETTTWNWI